MRTIIASVSTEDLTNYFKGGTWKSSIIDGVFRAKSREFKVKLTPKGAVYDVHVSSVDDPSDSDEMMTDDPAKFIASFLETGTPGDEFFKKRSSLGPDDVRDALLRLSSDIENGQIGPVRLAKILRRIVVKSGPTYRNTPVAARVAMNYDDFEVLELSKLRSKMADNGWRAKVEPGTNDHPILKIDIGEVYEATISVNHQSWDFRFETNFSDDLDDGATDDPIFVFQKFQKEAYNRPTEPQTTTEPT